MSRDDCNFVALFGQEDSCGEADHPGTNEDNVLALLGHDGEEDICQGWTPN